MIRAARSASPCAFPGHPAWVIPASRGGKAKTVAQMAAILLYIIPVVGWVADVRWPVMLIAVFLTVLTGLDYLQCG